MNGFKEENYKVIDVDGVRFVTEDGWGLIRASNTQAVLVVRYESKTQEGLERIKKILEDHMRKYIQVKLP